MVKDTRPKDLENRLKKKALLNVPEMLEKPVAQETSTEQLTEIESKPQPDTSLVDETPREDTLKTVRKAVSKVQAHQEDRLEEEIEDILEEDLKELYLSLPPDKQVEFREKGEEARSKIRVIVSSAKINAKKIFLLIRGWLKIIPGVNRFFLEQEAKIKTDKILLVSEEEKKRNDSL